MLNNNLDNLFFSQLSLSVFEKCPLKFRRRYLDGLYWPVDWNDNPEQKEMIERGRNFHLLAKRYYQRGEEPSLDSIDKQLKKWFNKLKRFLPYNNKNAFYPEYELRINNFKIRLVAKFDLLFIDKEKNKLIIYDWKTNKKRLDRKKLKDNLQSKVYLFVLTDTKAIHLIDNFDINNISIIYWNPRYDKKYIEIKYNQKKYQMDKKYFESLIQEIKSLNYEQFEKTDNKRFCKYCEYRPICEGEKAEQVKIEEDDIDLEINWDEIGELNF
ncbi:MAG: PD-(D/E)XK nuclease family protein [Bacillota bacterium]